MKLKNKLIIFNKTKSKTIKDIIALLKSISNNQELLSEETRLTIGDTELWIYNNDISQRIMFYDAQYPEKK